MKRFKTLIIKSSLLIFAAWLGLVSPLCVLSQPASSGALYLIYRKGKWGYSDRDGRVVIKPQFETAFEFQDGLALASVGRMTFSFKHSVVIIRFHGKNGYIDKTGRFVSDKLTWHT